MLDHPSVDVRERDGAGDDVGTVFTGGDVDFSHGPPQAILTVLLMGS
jgi:hypothetical protein